MDDQAALVERANNFLKRRGLRANYLAQQTGISIPTMYCWKSGYRLLTEQQLQRLRSWMEDYDRKMGNTDAEGVFENDACGNAYQNQPTALTKN